VINKKKFWRISRSNIIPDLNIPEFITRRMLVLHPLSAFSDREKTTFA